MFYICIVFDNLSLRRGTLSYGTARCWYRDLRLHRRARPNCDTVYKLLGKKCQFTEIPITMSRAFNLNLTFKLNPDCTAHVRVYR